MSDDAAQLLELLRCIRDWYIGGTEEMPPDLFNAMIEETRVTKEQPCHSLT
jgi:hypothetical protein